MAPRAKPSVAAAEKDAMLQIAPKKPPGPQCSHCLKHVSADLAFITCAHPACNNLPMCLDCFRVGAADTYPHQTNHPYRIIARNDTPLYENDWTVDEEVRLLHALSTFGPHHWADVANYVGKTTRKCELHYQNVYHNGVNVPLATARTKPRANAKKTSVAKAVCIDMSSEAHSYTPSAGSGEIVPEREATGNVSADEESDDESIHPDPAHGNNTKVTGFMPKRFDLEVDYDDHAENLVADLGINPTDTDEEKDLKARLIEIYDQRVQRRESAKQFIQQKKLLDFASLRCTDRRAPRDEKELSARLQVFSRLMPAQQFDKFYGAVTKQYRMSREIYRLSKCREAGMKTRAEVDIYDVERKGRAAHIASISKRRGRLPTTTPSSNRKKRSTVLTRRRSTSMPGTPATPATPASADVSEQGSEVGTGATHDCADVVDIATPQPGSPNGDGVESTCALISDGSSDAAALRKARQWKRISKSPYPRLEAMPVDDLPDLQKLTTTEKRLCSMLHITPKEFLCQRDAMLHTAAGELRAVHREGDGKEDVIMLRCQPVVRPVEGGMSEGCSRAPVEGGGEIGVQCTQVDVHDVDAGDVVEVGMEVNVMSKDCGTFLDVTAAVGAEAYEEGDMRGNDAQRVGLETCVHEDMGAGVVVEDGENDAKDGLHDSGEGEGEDNLRRPVSVVVDGSGPTCFEEQRRADVESGSKLENPCNTGTQCLSTDIDQENCFARERSVDVNVGTSVMYGPNMEMEGGGLTPAENTGGASNEVQLFTDMTGEMRLMVEVDTRAVGSFGNAMKSDDSIGDHVREALGVVNGDKKEEFSPVVNVPLEGELNHVHSCENGPEVVQDENINENVHDEVDEDCEDILVACKRRRVGDSARESTCVHAVQVCETVMEGMTEVKGSKEASPDLPENGEENRTAIKRNRVFVKRMDVEVPEVVSLDGDMPTIVKVEKRVVKTEGTKANGKAGGRQRKTARKTKRMRKREEVACVAEEQVVVKREILLDGSEAVEEVLDEGGGNETCTDSEFDETVMEGHEDDIEPDQSAKESTPCLGTEECAKSVPLKLRIQQHRRTRAKQSGKTLRDDRGFKGSCRRPARGESGRRGMSAKGGVILLTEGIEPENNALEREVKCLDVDDDSGGNGSSLEEVLEEGQADDEPEGYGTGVNLTTERVEVLNIPKTTWSSASADVVLNIPKASVTNAPVLNIPKAQVANVEVLEIPKASVTNAPVLNIPKAQVANVEVLEIPKASVTNVKVLNIPKTSKASAVHPNVLNIPKVPIATMANSNVLDILKAPNAHPEFLNISKKRNNHTQVQRIGEYESDEAVVIVKTKAAGCRRSTRIHKRERKDDESNVDGTKRVKTEVETNGRADDDSCLYIPKPSGLRRSVRWPARGAGKSPAHTMLTIGRAAAAQAGAEMGCLPVRARGAPARTQAGRSSCERYRLRKKS